MYISGPPCIVPFYLCFKTYTWFNNRFCKFKQHFNFLMCVNAIQVLKYYLFRIAVITMFVHTHTTVQWPFVWDYLGEPVPEEAFTHSDP